MLTTNVVGQNTDIAKWDNKQLNDWINNSVWVKGFTKEADSSVNKRKFVEQNIVNPKSWEAACEFLTKNDLENMPIGNYNLLNDGTYATVTDYMTKDAELAYFEAHRKFIDIQYVAKGEEYIRLTTLDLPLKMHIPYNKDNDIEFFSKKEWKLLLATPKTFFVFFPSDAHMPCLKVKNNTPVRKIVVKIPYIN